MELRTYLAIVQRRKLLIAAAVGSCIILAIVGTFLMPPVYIATAKLRIATAGDIDGSITVGGFTASPGHSSYAPAVPVPAAAWLFGSGLLGLGAARQRKTRF